MKIKITDDFIFVQTPYELREYVQEHLNGTYSKKEKMYRFPLNIHVLRELYKAFPQLQHNQEFIEQGKMLRWQQDELLKSRKVFFRSPNDRLRPYQREDVNYLKLLPSAGIFNEPRTGKTPMTITLLRELGTRRNIVVCPASLIWNWAKEFETWYPEALVDVVTGSKPRRYELYDRFKHVEEPCVIIVSKDTLKLDIDEIEKIRFDVCVVDEAHFLRNYKTDQSKAVFKVKADRRYALTGTPTVKGPDDIFGILHFLYPKKFPSYWQFVERYFEIGINSFGGTEVGNVKAHRQKELQELVGMLSVQRKRADVMEWLPKKQYITFHVKMEEQQKKVYQKMVDDFIVEVDGAIAVDAPNVLAQLTRLRQLCLDPALLGLDTPSAKTKALLEWLENNKEPVVIMSMFTSYLKLLKPKIEKLGRKVTMIYGEMPNHEKEKAKTLFQNGQADVILCNIISAGTGHTLDRAETVIFTDLAWNPTDNEQAEDRITPVSEERNHAHNIITFNVVNTVDERINYIIQNKKSLTDIINEGAREAVRRLLL